MENTCVVCGCAVIAKYKKTKCCSKKCDGKYRYRTNTQYFIDYGIKNHDKLLNYAKQFQLDNPEYNKNYYQKNKEKILKQMKEINKKRKPRKNELSRIRYSSDPLYKLRMLLSTSIYRNLKGLEASKQTSFRNLVPYSIAELKVYLEKLFTLEMNWDNYGPYWHLDHKTPVNWFQHKNELLKYGYSLENLHPVKKEYNLSKNSNYCSDVLLALSLIGR